MNEHARCLQLAISELDFALSPTQAALVSVHLAGCVECRAECEAVRTDGRRLANRAVQLPAPTRVREAVLAAALEEGAPSAFNRALVAIAMMALLVVLAGAAVSVGARLLELIEDSRLPVPVVTASPSGVLDPSAAPNDTAVLEGIDAIGDAGSGPDIVAIKTRAEQDRVVLTIELVAPLEPSERIQVRLRDGQNVHPAEPDPPLCGSWFTDGLIEVSASGVRDLSGTDTNSIPLTIDGSTVVMTIPLSLVNGTDKLYLAVWTRDLNGWTPDARVSDHPGYRFPEDGEFTPNLGTYRGAEDFYPEEVKVEDYQECFPALMPRDGTDPTAAAGPWSDQP